MQSLDNGTISNDNLRPLYYRHHKHDLNSTFRHFKRPKPLQSILLTSRRNKIKQKKLQSLSEDPLVSDKSENFTIRSTTVTTTPLIVSSTTNGVTKSTDELNANTENHDTTTENLITINPDIKSTSSTKQADEIQTTTEHSLSYNVTVDKPNQPSHKLRRKNSMSKISNAIWSKWEKWTKCSRSCGGGVMSQSRLCLTR